jgi:hypothetical protein
MALMTSAWRMPESDLARAPLGGEGFGQFAFESLVLGDRPLSEFGRSKVVFYPRPPDLVRSFCGGRRFLRVWFSSAARSPYGSSAREGPVRPFPASV